MPGIGNGLDGVIDPNAGVELFSCTPQQFLAVSQLVGLNSATASEICATRDVTTLGANGAVLSWTVSELLVQQQRTTEVEYGLNTAFLLASAYQVFIMQTGFALYAAGVVRGKNVVMILLKNFMDTGISCISFYLLGYAFAFGDNGSSNGFIGNFDFALSETQSAFPAPYALWLWNFAFAAASTTILSGSIAERATFQSYLIYSILMTTWVYPVVTHWIWSTNGWLSAFHYDSILKAGCMDFAGSGVVHMVGGVASLMGSLATGPRVGRFDGSLPSSAFKGNSAPLYVLGTFMLWFGWYGFNPGSHQAIASYELASNVARTAVTTTLAGGAGAVTSLAVAYYRTRTWDLLQVCTGALAGLVAVTAGCALITPWAAIIVGVVAAPIYIYTDVLLERLHIDDPVGAFPVHGACGAWGLLFVGLLAKEEYVVSVYQKQAGQHLMGIFYGGHGQILLCQVIAILVIAAWTSFWMGALFSILNYFGQLRVPLVHEAMGMDMAACGGGLGMDPKQVTKFTQNAPYIPGLSHMNLSNTDNMKNRGSSPGNGAISLNTIIENGAGNTAVLRNSQGAIDRSNHGAAVDSRSINLTSRGPSGTGMNAPLGSS